MIKIVYSHVAVVLLNVALWLHNVSKHYKAGL